MKYGIKKYFDAAANEGAGGNATPLTSEVLLKELTTIKGALEKNFEKKADEQTKNFELKLKAADDAIADLKSLMETKDKDNEEKLKAIQDEAKVTQKAFDLFQLEVKAQKGVSYNNGGQQEDNSLPGQIYKAFEGFKKNLKADNPNIAKGANEAALQMKALTDMSVVNSISTGVVPNTYRPSIVPLPFEMVHLRDLVNVTPSETDSYHFYRHTGGDGDINWQVQELATKAQIDEDFSETTVNLDYLAGWLRISRKMLRNFTALQAYITRWLPERYYQKEDTKGWQAILAQATGTAVVASDIITSIIRTIGSQKKARYNVTGIVLDGAVWANILTLHATTSGEFTMPFSVVTIAPTGQLLICGIPVYTASWVGSDTVIVADWRNFEIIQSEGLALQFFEQDGTNVRENKITCRIEASIGYAMLNPAAFAVLNVSTVS